MWGFYITVMLAVLAATALLIRRYAAPTVQFVVVPFVAVAWATAMSVVALVPIDVWTANYLTGSQKQPTQHKVEVLWSISYWTTQALTWFVIPIMLGFSDAGDFTVLGKLRTSLRENLRFWMIMVILGVVGFFFLLFTGRLTGIDLYKTAIIASNTYGLIAVMVLLGYGLVEIPRTVWRRSFPESRLQWHHYRVGRAAERLQSAGFDLQRLLQVVQATSGPISRRDPLRRNMDLIVGFVEHYSPIALDEVNVDVEGLTDTDLDYGIDINGLASLRRRAMRTINMYLAARTQYIAYVKRAFQLDAICRARATRDYAPPEGGRGVVAAMRWRYQCLIKPWVLRLAAVGLGGLSTVFVWSEATIGLGRDPDLSPFSIALTKAPDGELLTQTIVAVPLSYMCLCAYYSLFKLGMFSFYQLVPRSSGGSSMLRSGSLLCRFAAPLCFNLLHVIRMDNPAPENETVFVNKVGGAMRDLNVSFVGAQFNRWFPITMVVYTILLVFEVWDNCLTRALTRLGRLFASERADVEHTERGRALVQAEQDAVLRGGAIGEGLDTFQQPGAAGLTSSTRARAALQMGQVSSSWGSKSTAASGGARRSRGPPPPSEMAAASQGGAGLLQGLRGMLGSPSSTKQTSEHSVPSAAAAVLASIRSKQAGGGSTAERLPLMTGSSSSTHTVGGGVARRGSGGGSLDAIFARLDGRGGTGRIDDDDMM